tara:strand:- start:520 stop:2148 length:1629 start_codon:yes stop_codon:yes gene_type:complete
MRNLAFDLPQNQSSVIKVIGVGGGGSNAVNYMFQKGIKGVDFIVCNTDQQALDSSPISNKIPLGVTITEGLGAGGDPLRGKFAAEENINDVIEILRHNTKMVFINAGMGGGTGTGAAPVIAKAAKDNDILTVAIVTTPFEFEGDLRMKQAKEGILELKKYVDSIIVINNNRLKDIYGDLGFKSGFEKADEILATASKGISEVITQKGHVNIDLNDARTVLAKSGTAIMGSSSAVGSERALNAVKGAIESPLLDNGHIRGAKKVLLLILSGKEEVTFKEMDQISSYIQNEVTLDGDTKADIIMGVAENEELNSSINITVVATGFQEIDNNILTNNNSSIIIHNLNNKIKSREENNICDKLENSSKLKDQNLFFDDKKNKNSSQAKISFEFDISDNNEFEKKSDIFDDNKNNLEFNRQNNLTEKVQDSFEEVNFKKEECNQNLNHTEVNNKKIIDINQSDTKVENFKSNSTEVKEQLERANKRKERLQKFNYKFRSRNLIDNQKISEIHEIELNDKKKLNDNQFSKSPLDPTQNGSIEFNAKSI